MSPNKPFLIDSDQEILAKARQGQGLLPEEAFFVLKNGTLAVWDEVFRIARELTARHFGNRIRFFAPLYYSDYCVNDCVYCSFRSGNMWMTRTLLSEAEMLSEARRLWEDGHRSLLLVAGEHRRVAGPDKMASYADALKREGLDFELSFEVGPLDEAEYALLAQHGFGRVVLYQETYDRNIYTEVHPFGPKKNFDWRYATPARALRSGIKDVGLGVLLGLAPDWQTELLELYRHAHDIYREFGKFPATFSFPRLRPADGYVPPHSNALVDDVDYEKILALTRIVFPGAGLVLSTRESSEFRGYLLKQGVGITHLSAGVSTVTGGYTQKRVIETGQFDICDDRSLAEVMSATNALGFTAEFRSPAHG